MTGRIPDGYRSLTPSLCITNAPAAIEFYKKAFGAEELMRLPGPDGRLMHAEIKIGDSILMIGEEFIEWGAKSPTTLGGSPVSIHIYVVDIDRAWQRAVDAGATVTMPLSNMFWGDRFGMLKDPFGHTWSLASQVEQLSEQEMQKRMETAMKEGCCPESKK